MTTTLTPPTHGSPRPHKPLQRYVGPAMVVEDDPTDSKGPGGRTRTRVSIPGALEEYEAELAVPTPTPLEPGRRVLVTLADDGMTYVTGILDQPTPQVETRAGGTASVVEDEEGERIEVRDNDDNLVLRYDPSTGAAHLRVPQGGLSVAAPDGDLTLAAGGTVRLHGESVEVSARSRVRLMVHDLAGRALSTLRMGRQSTQISTPRARLDAHRTDVALGRASISGDHLETRASSIRTTAERIETVADRVTERVGSAYRNVKELLQTRAGRVRTLVSGTWRARSKRADLRSEENFKVDGRRIHLG